MIHNHICKKSQMKGVTKSNVLHRARKKGVYVFYIFIYRLQFCQYYKVHDIDSREFIIINLKLVILELMFDWEYADDTSKGWDGEQEVTEHRYYSVW